MSESFSWNAPPISPEDQRLIDAYLRVRRAVDDLPYTPEFEQILQEIGAPHTPESRHDIFKRLLTLRKMGRLPRVSSVVT
jgi:hypothetical protein